MKGSTYFINWTEFCGNNQSQIWNEDKLNFTICFQKYALELFCYAIFAVSSAFYIGNKSSNIVRYGRPKSIIICRVVASASSIIIAILESSLVYSIWDHSFILVDIIHTGVQVITWTVHILYLINLQHSLTEDTRGPKFVVVSWFITLLFTINYTRSQIDIFGTDTSNNLEMFIMLMAVSRLAFQVLYLITLFPEGRDSNSHYQELWRNDAMTRSGEGSVLSHSNYDRFHEEIDPHHLGIAEEGSNFFSYLIFYWANPLLKKGSMGYIQSVDDIYDLPLNLRTDYISQLVNKTLLVNQPLPGENDEQTSELHEKNILLKALHKCFGRKFYSIGILKFVGDGLGFVGPLLLHEMVNFVANNEQKHWKGYVYALGLCLAAFIGCLCTIHYNYLMAKVNIQLRAGLVSSIYRKVQQVNSASLSKFTSGEIVNMMSTDTDRIVNFCPSFHAFWTIPMQLAVTLYLLHTQVGIAYLAGLGITLVLLPINRFIAVKIGKLSKEMMAFKDKRVSMMKEILSMIKILKLNAWESLFEDKIKNERYQEVKALSGSKYLDAACVYFWASTPILIPIATFGTYIALGNDLDPARVFTAVALFNMLIAPLNSFPWVLNGLVEAWVSMKRIEKLMQVPDQNFSEFYTVLSEMSHKGSDLQVLVADASFTWDMSNSNIDENYLEDNRWSGPGCSRQSSIRSRNSEISVVTDTSPQCSGINLQSPVLKNVSLHINKGEIVGIVGNVGSGKTTLLNAVLGEIQKIKGVVAVAALHQGFGLATQKPWIQNISIKENIMFGSCFEDNRYRMVMQVCCLEDDLKSFPRGDETLCGENGSCLSGGQRARIALARAVYQNKSVYLLDDVLSAVDGPVARHIMKNCIHGFLSGKTVILTTHHTSYLTRVDRIIHMENNTIKEQGPPSLILPQLLSMDVFDDDWWEEMTSSPSDPMSAKKKAKDFTKVTSIMSHSITELQNEEQHDDLQNEMNEYGYLSYEVYLQYLKAIGVPLSLLIFVSLFLMQLSRNLSDMWLAHWVSHDESDNGTVPSNENKILDFYATLPGLQEYPISAHQLTKSSSYENKIRLDADSNDEKVPSDVLFYLGIYGMLAISNSMFTLMRAFFFAYGGICAAKSLHKSILSSILYAKMKFFDSNPLGRILNRFSTDIYTVDDSLPFQLNIFLAQLFGLVGSLLITIYGIPWIVLLFVPLAFMYYTIQEYYRHSSRNLRRIYSVSLSPLYTHFAETLEGLPVIRATRSMHRFSVLGENYLEQSQKAQLNLQIVAQWLNLRLQLIGIVILGGVCILAILQHHIDTINPGLVGLVISYALTINGYLNAVVTSFTETERELVSVERLRQYIIGSDVEEPKTATMTTPPGWPMHGEIQMKDVYLKYHDHNPYSLCNVSLDIGGSEKVGIVGRTGAGKSSLFMALFRVSEFMRGKIFIDGVDVSKISLKKLRTSIAIVSQETLIFSGTVRENLDPRGENVDDQVWRALRLCHLGDLVRGIGGLGINMNAAGQCLSTGEKQLFCLARVLLSQTKIVCIDEGTASLDNSTDELVQQAIREAFCNKTVLIIAHRVKTVQDCDKIVVMQDGGVVEVGRTAELLANKESLFSSIMFSQ